VNPTRKTPDKPLARALFTKPAKAMDTEMTEPAPEDNMSMPTKVPQTKKQNKKQQHKQLYHQR